MSNNKPIAIELLKQFTKLKIKDLEFEDLKNINDLSGYDFSTVKIKAILENSNETNNININKESNIENNNINNQIYLYLKIIQKDKIKESIFCYWDLLYDELFKNNTESEFTTIINKVKITETESEEYKHSVLLEIQENKWGILKNGTTIHLVKLEKYLNDNKIKKSKELNEWKKYIEKGSEDVLFIGCVKC